MRKSWISFWTVLLAVALGGQSRAAQPGQAGGAGPQMVKVGGVDVHPTQILARLKEPAQAGFVAKRLAAKGYTVKRQYRLVPGMMLIERPAAPLSQVGNAVKELQRRIAELKSSGWFLYVETDRAIKLYASPSDAAYKDGSLWGLLNYGQNSGLDDADIDADEAWDITTGNRQVIVSVIDTGVRYTHVDLVNQMWVNEDEIPNNSIDDDNDGWVDNVHGIDPSDNDGDPFDPVSQGHGTHCAGTIGAEANNGEPHVGVAWDVTIMACKIFGSGAFTSAAMTSVEFSVENGAKVANCSWGGVGSNPPLYDVFAAGGEAGMVFSCASGNSAMDNDIFGDWPSGFDLECVIAVAASDNQDEPAGFTNYGLESVDLAAPGVDIFSSLAASDTAYTLMSGTSMSGPHVAGVLALMKGLQPDWSVLQIREKLLESVDLLPSFEGLIATGGRVNAFKAVSNMKTQATGLPDGNMEVSIKPSSGSVLLADTDQPIFVEVIDGAPVTDAVVIGFLDDGTELYFNNDGDFPDVEEKDNVYSYYLPLPEQPRKMRLTLLVTAPDKEDYLRVVKYDIVPIPENDNFVDAAKLSPVGGVVEAFNTFATIEDGEPKHGLTSMPSGSLWWNWSPSESGTMHVDISGSNIDGVVSVYYGTTFGNLLEVANNLPIDGVRPEFVQFEGKKSKTYRIVVAGVNGDELGYIRLRAEVNGQPDINPPYVSVTSPPNGLVTTEKHIALIGGAVDPSPNSSGIREVLVRVNNGIGVTAVGAEEWNIPVVLIEGINKIEVFAFDYSDNISKTFRMQLDYREPDVPNDHFSNATQMNRDRLMADGSQTKFTLSQPIAEVEEILVKANGQIVELSSYEVFEFNSRVLVFDQPPAKGAEVEVFHPVWQSQPVNTGKATRETGEPEHAGNDGGGSVWWTFTAPYDGLLNVRTVNTMFDTVMGAYVGTRVNRLRLVTSNDDDPALVEMEDNPGYSRITQALKKGMKLMVAADGFGDMRGELVIVSDFEATSVHELSVTTDLGGSVPSPRLPFGSEQDGQYALYAQNSAVQIQAKPDKGYEFSGWSGSISSLDNPIRLAITDSTNIEAKFNTISLSDDFESGNLAGLPWSTEKSSGWFVQPKVKLDGDYAMQSGEISDGETSEISVMLDCSNGIGSFYVKLDTEINWDKLTFLIDGRIVEQWSGKVEWNKYEFNLTEGGHKLTWRYQKDFANSIGADSAWVDNIKLPLSLKASVGLVVSDNGHKVRVWGVRGHRYNVQVSDDLTTWKSFDSVIIDADGITDTEVEIDAKYGAAYFRAVAP